MEKREASEPCGSDCHPIQTERNRFFTGKYMTARDFAADRDYMLGRHRLHNRLLHGSGVVCGLGVTRHPDKRCPNWLVIGPGIAIDCCGRELVVTDRVPYHVEIPGHEDLPGHDCGQESHSQAEPSVRDADKKRQDQNDSPTQEREHAEGEKPEDREAYLLCAVYSEEEIEHVPVIYNDCGCDPDSTEANRIRESVILELHPLADFDQRCWGWPAGGGGGRCRDDCDDQLPASGGGCIEPECYCGDCVPLALIVVQDDGSLEVSTDGRQQLPPPPEYLTHITATSWVHGSTVPMADLADAGRLVIEFDRKIAPASGFVTGINPETLLVEHAGEGEALEFVPYDLDHPPHLVDDCRAVYVIDPDFLNGRRRGGLIGSTIYVTLLADFVLDCHGLPVDGDHLGGQLPSGNRVQGGTFRSWFRVGDSRDEEVTS